MSHPIPWGGTAVATGPKGGHAQTRGDMDTGYKKFSSSTGVAKLALTESMLLATQRQPLWSQRMANTELGRDKRQTDRWSPIWAESLRVPEALSPEACSSWLKSILG